MGIPFKSIADLKVARRSGSPKRAPDRRSENNPSHGCEAISVLRPPASKSKRQSKWFPAYPCLSKSNSLAHIKPYQFGFEPSVQNRSHNDAICGAAQVVNFEQTRVASEG